MKINSLEYSRYVVNCRNARCTSEKKLTGIRRRYLLADNVWYYNNELSDGNRKNWAEATGFHVVQMPELCSGQNIRIEREREREREKQREK